ncbi:MAG: hypothetical protein ACYSWP_20495 [Planctomycetota bacterium]|jgi:hypothetical protein
MGWGRTLLLGDIGNRLDIEDTEQDIARLKQQITGNFNKDMSQDQKIEALINENADLKLYLASLIRLLMAKGNITQLELEAMVKAVDAEDGKTNGRLDTEIV